MEQCSQRNENEEPGGVNRVILGIGEVVEGEDDADLECSGEEEQTATLLTARLFVYD